MNGNLKKYLSTTELASLESVRSIPVRKSALRRSLERKAYHRANKDKENKQAREYYHNKLKSSPKYKAQMKKQWDSFKARMLLLDPHWQKKRSLKYRKPYSKLSEQQKERMQLHQARWQKLNWKERVLYARKWRRKQSTFGLRKAISQANRSGDIRELTRVCEHAIARAYEKSRKQRS